MAVETSLGAPSAVAADLAGNVYFTVRDLNSVFKLDRNGLLTRVAGSSTAGFSGDGGPATSARLGSRFKGTGGPQSWQMPEAICSSPT